MKAFPPRFRSVAVAFALSFCVHALAAIAGELSAQPATTAQRPIIDLYGGLAVGGGLLGTAAVVLRAFEVTQSLRTRVAAEIRREIAAQEAAERKDRMPQPFEIRPAQEFATKDQLERLEERFNELVPLAQKVAAMESSIQHIGRGVEAIEVLLMTKGGAR